MLKTVNVGYDYQIFCIQNYGGISRYFSALAKGIKNRKDVVADLKMLYSENGYIDTESCVLPHLIGHRFLKKKSRMWRWNRRYQLAKLKEATFHVFHPTYYDPYFLPLIKTPYVVTVHDMIHELFPEFFPSNDTTSYNKRKIVEKASHVIVISESTKRDLQHFYNIPESKISVIHHGYFSLDVSQKNINQPFKIEIIERPYILFVGDRTKYKNFYRFTTALSQLIYQYPELKLICAGGGAFEANEYEHLRKIKLEDKVIQISADEVMLKHLYKNALFFCYPSLYEGFGLPILEAFANSCPAVVSNTSCFEEVGDNAAAYFNPYDIDDMRSKFKEILDSAEVRKELVSNGLTRLGSFANDICLERTISVYKGLV